MTQIAALYIRQSQTSDGTISPELQEKNVRSFIASQGWEAGDLYLDIDKSGLTEAQRPGFLKLKKDYKAGKFQVAVADDFSRFSRNRVDAMALLGSMNIATAKEGPADADDDFMPAMHFLLADKFSKDMSKRWKNALMRRFEKGLPPSGKPQFGYDKQGKEAYVINPEQAAIIKEAYSRYTQGEGSRTICEDFTRRCLPAAGPSGWYPNGLFDLLDKEFYAGRIVWAQKAKPGQEKPEPLVIDGAHEPLLTPAEWAAYRKARDARKKHTKPRNPKWMLAGLVVCGRCGGKMLSHPVRGVHNLMCATYNAKGKDACPGMFRKRSTVMVAVWWWLGAHEAEWASAMPTDDEARIAAERAVADTETALEEAKQKYGRYQKYAFESGIRGDQSAATLTEYSADIDAAEAAHNDALADLGSFAPAADLHEQITKGSLLMGFSEDPDAEVSEAATAKFREALSQIIEKVIVLPPSTTAPRDPKRKPNKEIKVVPRVRK